MHSDKKGSFRLLLLTIAGLALEACGGGDQVKTTASIGVAPASINIGASATLTWTSSSNVTGCTASGAWTGTRAPNGTLSVSPGTTGSHVYTLSCQDSAGVSAGASATLLVTTPGVPTVNLAFPASRVVQGTNSTLTWSSANATSCTASGAWSGSKPVSGNETISTPTVGSFTYTLTCQNSVAVATAASATLAVTTPPKITLGTATQISVTGDPAPPAPNFPLTQFVDLDGNGWDDMVMTGAYYPEEGSSPAPRQGYVAFGGPSGFSASAAGPFPYTTMMNVHAREFAFVDLNGDGVRDVFIADHGYDAPPFPGFQNRLYLSQGGNATWVDATANLPQQWDFTHSVCTGDVNADSRIDILAGNYGFARHAPLSEAYFLIGNGSGAFTKNSLILPINAGQAMEGAGVALMSCALADLDADGLPELVLGTQYLGRSRQILWNTGGSFATSAITALPPPTNFGTAWAVHDIVATDLDGDGRQDLILVYQGHVADGGWQFQFLVNQGNRQFTDQTGTYLPDAAAASSIVPSSASPLPWIDYLLPKDLNGDGLMDYWVEINARYLSRSDNVPVALIRQRNGQFVPVKVGELKAAGLPSSALNGFLRYARRGPSQSGALVREFRQTADRIAISVTPITFR